MARRTSEFDLHRSSKKMLAAIVIGLYAAACSSPAVYVEGFPSTTGPKENPARLGIVALLLGWSLGLPGSNFSAGFPSCVPWSANWFLFVGWGFLLANRFGTAAWLAAVATVLALATWATAVAHLLIGYYLWHASMLVLMIGAIILFVTASLGDEKLPNKSLNRSGS
jgi:hypothetical protein